MSRHGGILTWSADWRQQEMSLNPAAFFILIEGRKMKETTRRDFLKRSVCLGGAVLSTQIMGGQLSFAGGGKKLNLNVGYLPVNDHLIFPVSHARDNSKFKNLNVKPYLCRSWDEMAAKIDMGILQAAFLLVTMAMHKASTGAHFRCVLVGHTNGSVIAGSKSIAGAQGLRGKNIGTPHPRSTHRVLVYKYLKDSGMDMRSDVKLVTVAPPLTVKSLRAGRISAYSVAEPWGIKGVNDGAAKILELSKNIVPDHPCCIVMVKSNIIEDFPDAVSEWVRSLQEAGKYIHADIDRAAMLQKTYMKHEPGEIAQVIKQEMISYLDLAPERKRFSRIHELGLESGVLSGKCNFDEFIDDRFASRT